MALKSSSIAELAERELTITRVFNAPQSLVFEAWTQREHFSRWLGPKDFTTMSCEMDVRLGGTYRACIRLPFPLNSMCFL